MSSENLANINAARQADGKFGNQLHPEAIGVTIGADRPEWLDGWPATLPEPELSFHMGDDNVITTSASIGGETFVEAWNPGDDVHSLESHAFDLEDTSVEEAEAAEDWVKAKHEKIASDLRAEMLDAVERARYRVMAKATGIPAPVSTDELDGLIVSNGAAVNQAQKDLELASTARIARGILEDWPEAETMVIEAAEVDDQGEVITGIYAQDVNGEMLHEWGVNNLEPWSDCMANLSANNGWWGKYTPKHATVPDDYYTINLKDAAAWSPGAP